MKLIVIRLFGGWPRLAHNFNCACSECDRSCVESVSAASVTFLV